MIYKLSKVIMYTILCRIFDPDIAQLIYELNIKSYINFQLIPKLFVIDLQVYKFIQKYSQIKYTRIAHDLMLDFYEIQRIYEILLHTFKTLVSKKHYVFNPVFAVTIKNFNDTIKNVNRYQPKSYIQSGIALVSHEMDQYV